LANPLGLRDQPNNLTVLERLAEAGVEVAPAEAELISRLRRLRNDLHHSSARCNHRASLALCRSAVSFVDRFAQEELHAWAGDMIPPDAWHQLLAIEEIRSRAMRVIIDCLPPYREDPEVTITNCSRCEEQACSGPARTPERVASSAATSLSRRTGELSQ